MDVAPRNPSSQQIQAGVTHADRDRTKDYAHIGHIEGIASMLTDRVNLPAPTSEMYSRYKNAIPFPHLVIDNLFPTETLEDMLEELPPLTDDKWVHDRNAQSVKSNFRSAVDLGSRGYQFAAFLNSAGFLYLLSEMTGIWGLLGDPYLGGAGYHVVPAGGKFEIHADRKHGYEYRPVPASGHADLPES